MVRKATQQTIEADAAPNPHDTCHLRTVMTPDGAWVTCDVQHEYVEGVVTEDNMMQAVKAAEAGA